MQLDALDPTVASGCSGCTLARNVDPLSLKSVSHGTLRAFLGVGSESGGTDVRMGRVHSPQGQNQKCSSTFVFYSYCFEVFVLHNKLNT